MNDEEFVDKCIQELNDDFDSSPNKFLTEEDVRFHLCLRLLEKYGKIEDTKDEDKSIALHTEVRWWGVQHSKKRSDIVVLDVSELKVTQSEVKRHLKLGRIPSKGYSANKPLVVIELKFRRCIELSDAKYIEQIQKDALKLKALSETVLASCDPKPILRVIAFDKRQDISRLIPNVPDIVIKYHFSNTAKI